MSVEQEQEEITKYVRGLSFSAENSPEKKMAAPALPEGGEETPSGADDGEGDNAIVAWIKESNIAKAKKAMECLVSNDRATLRDQLLVPNVEWTNRRGGTREGIDAMFGKLGGLQAIFPDTTYEVANFVATDAHTVAYDNIMRIEPGGRVFRNRSVVTFDDAGRIVTIDNSKPLDKEAEAQLGTGTKLFPALVPVVNGKSQVY